MNRLDIKNLKRRYLIWLYKTNKEALDKIERKFTQAEIDKFILKELRRQRKPELEKLIADFAAYIANKEKAGQGLKYGKGKLKADYQFLFLKLAAIEKAIQKELGKKALGEIKTLYEKEMTERILKNVEHK